MTALQESNETRRSTANPWIQSSRIYASIGGLREVLKVEKQFGLLEDLQRKTDITVDTQSDDETIGAVGLLHSGRLSLEKINFLIQISKLKKEVKRLETEIIVAKAKEQTSDIMDVESVNLVINMLQQKSKQLGNIIKQKQDLLNALQDDTADCLVLPIESQEHLNNCIHLLSKQLGDNLYHLENIEWVAKLQKRVQEVQDDFDLMSWYTNHLKQYFVGVNECRELMIRRTKEHLKS